MKTKIALLLCCLMLLVSSVASACGPYVLIPDSGVRELTRQELEQYSYYALTYIGLEIGARRGYHFDPDSELYEHFSSIYEYDERTGTYKPFYVEAPASVTNEMIVDSISTIEKKNILLALQVQRDKELRGEDTSPDPSLWLCDEDW